MRVDWVLKRRLEQKYNDVHKNDEVSKHQVLPPQLWFEMVWPKTGLDSVLARLGLGIFKNRVRNSKTG